MGSKCVSARSPPLSRRYFLLLSLPGGLLFLLSLFFFSLGDSKRPVSWSCPGPSWVGEGQDKLPAVPPPIPVSWALTQPCSRRGAVTGHHA